MNRRLGIEMRAARFCGWSEGNTDRIGWWDVFVPLSQKKIHVGAEKKGGKPCARTRS
jgi:hypothetical protein